MKTPDAVCCVTKKETCDGVEGARGRALLNAEAEERARGRGRGECPRQNALRASALLEVTGAHGTKETTRWNALKARAARLTSVDGVNDGRDAASLSCPHIEPHAMIRIGPQRRAAAVALAFALSACASGALSRTGGDRYGASAAFAAERELTADQQVAHALSRLTFGARPGDAAAVRAMGVDRWIARQLEPERIRDDPG